jgi:hypothetical protein
VLASNIVHLLVNKRGMYKNARYTPFQDELLSILVVHVASSLCSVFVFCSTDQ